jgi:hypothetical protein
VSTLPCVYGALASVMPVYSPAPMGQLRSNGMKKHMNPFQVLILQNVMAAAPVKCVALRETSKP